MRSVLLRRWRVPTAVAGVVTIVVLLAGCFGDGTFLVGSGKTQVAPGLYTTSVAPGGFCSRARLRSTSGTLDAVITNDTVSGGRAFLLVARSDRAVESDRCGVWVPVSAKSYNPTPTRMVDGEYRVNVDVWAGTYRAPGGSGCYWARRSSWDGVEHHHRHRQPLRPRTADRDDRPLGRWVRHQRLWLVDEDRLKQGGRAGEGLAGGQPLKHVGVA